MPKKPHSQSVTGKPCTCKTLENAADEPNSPVEFDAQLNEYNIATRGGGTQRIYHCFFCGGAAPRSRRAALFATVTEDERERLKDLATGFANLAQVIRKFGKSDEDMEAGIGSITPERNGKPPKIEQYHTLRYHSLSKTAVVDFVDYGPEHGVRATFHGKYIGNGRPRYAKKKTE